MNKKEFEEGFKESFPFIYREILKQVGTNGIKAIVNRAEQYAKQMCDKQKEIDSKIAEEFEPDEKLDYVEYASQKIKNAPYPEELTKGEWDGIYTRPNRIIRSSRRKTI